MDNTVRKLLRLLRGLLTIQLPEGHSTVVGNFSSGDSSFDVADDPIANGWRVGDFLTVESTDTYLGIMFQWVYRLEIQSIVGNTITVVGTIGGSGINDTDIVRKENMEYFKADFITDNGYFVIGKNLFNNWIVGFNAFINEIFAGTVNPASPYSASGFDVVIDGISRASFGYFRLPYPNTLLQVVEAGFMIFNTADKLGGFLVTSFIANTGKMFVLGALSQEGLELGVTGGPGALYKATRVRRLWMVADRGSALAAARRAFFIDGDAMYNVWFGEQDMGSDEAVVGPTDVSLGDSIIPVVVNSTDQYNAGTYLHSFTVGATVTISQAGKTSTISTITAIDPIAKTLTIAGTAADDYDGGVALITQSPFSVRTRWRQGSTGNTTVDVNGETGDITTVGTVYTQGFRTDIRTITSSDTLVDTDYTVLANAASGAISATLPASTAGRVYVVKKTDSSVNAVTVVGTIDGATNYVLTAQYEGITVQGDGSNWFIIGLC